MKKLTYICIGIGMFGTVLNPSTFFLQIINSLLIYGIGRFFIKHAGNGEIKASKYRFDEKKNAIVRNQ